MARGRSFRRYKLELKKKAARYWGGSFFHTDEAKMLGRRASAPKCCSCYMCGNPRRHYGEISLQERKAILTEADE